MITEARKFLDSDQGKQFEQGLQQRFLGGGSGSDKSQQAVSQDNDGGDFNVDGDCSNAGQGQDSTSGMNSGEY